SKFWEVGLSGLDVTVRFGRIGTQGQTKTKTFATAAAATKERDKLIQEKTGKGYAEVAVAPGSALAPAAAPAAEASAGPVPASAPAPAAVESPAPSVAPIAPAALPGPSVAAPPAAPAGVEPLVWPQGGFDWTDALRAALPVVRGIHAPAVVHTVDAVLAARPAVDDRHHQYQTQAFADLAAALNPRWTWPGTWRPAARLMRCSASSMRSWNARRAARRWTASCAPSSAPTGRTGWWPAWPRRTSRCSRS
ncbi:WGR domain-containing protein, partial [Nostoc sp. NIES-2111]